MSAPLPGDIAERVGGSEGWRSRVLGYADVHLANVTRVDGNDLPAAGEAFERTRALWEAGAEEDPGLLDEARVLGMRRRCGGHNGGCPRRWRSSTGRSRSTPGARRPRCFSARRGR